AKSSRNCRTPLRLPRPSTGEAFRSTKEAMRAPSQPPPPLSSSATAIPTGRKKRRSGDDRTVMRVGIISDTHGVLHPRVPEVFAGVDHIIHAGDVGGGEILRALRRI